MISIIIPVYNGEKKIINALDSINCQTSKEYEVILVNDGSKDNTEGTVLKYMENNPNIKYFYKENSGVSDTRNYGFKKSKGEYVVFLDCDDYFDAEWIKKMNNKIKKDNSDLCYCGYNTFSSDGINKIKTQYKTKNALEGYLLGKIKLQTACFLIKREIIEKYNLEFRTGSDWGEDYEFFCKVLKYSKKITYLKENLTYYNIEDTDDKLSKFNVQQIEKNIKMIKNIEKEILLTDNERRALINYLAPALIVNFLYYNFNKLDKKLVKEIIYKNQRYIENMKFVNGLRSIKIYVLFQKIKREVFNEKSFFKKLFC